MPERQHVDPPGGERPLAEVTINDAAIWAILEAAPDGVVITDATGHVALVNSRLEEMFGYRREELLGDSVDKLVPASVRVSHADLRKRYVASPKPRPMGSDLELFAERADGSSFPAEISLSPCVIEGQEFVIAAVRDVTARRNNDQERRRIQHLLDGVSEGISIINAETLGFVYVNRGAADQSGRTPAELLETNPAELLTGVDLADLDARLAPLLEGEVGVVALEAHLLRPDGQELPLEVRFELAPEDTERDRWIVAITRDRSDRIALEREREHAAGLAAMIEDRERIARDLHDSVIQRVFGLGLQLTSLASRAPEELRDQIWQLVEGHDEVIAELRASIFGLHSHSTGSGLRNDLLAVVDEAQRSLGFRPSMRMDGPVDAVASTRLRQHVPAALREMLSNVIRHADARHVQVTVSVRDDEMSVRVTDDGIGLPTTERPAGHGLANLTARAEELGGAFRLEQVEPKGTAAVWTCLLDT